MKNSELVASVLKGLNSLNIDDYIPRRYILNVAKRKAITFMGQKFNRLSTFREMNLFKPIDCFELVKVDKFECDIVEFRSSDSVMKSKKRLPELVYFNQGSSVREVTNIDYTISFDPTIPSQYRNNKRRQEYKPEPVFYIKDGYLYLPDSNVARVSILMYTPNEHDINKASDCNKQCLNAWEAEFLCSSKILDSVITATIQELSIRKQIPEDENPNLDSNIKTKTVV